MSLLSSDKNTAGPGSAGLIGPSLTALIGAVLVFLVSGRGPKAVLLLILLLLCIAGLLAIGRSRVLRPMLLFALGGSLVINPNFFFVLFKIDHYSGAAGFFVSLTDLLVMTLTGLAYIGRKKIETPRIKPGGAIWVFIGFYFVFALLSLVHSSAPELSLSQLVFEAKLILIFALLAFFILPSGGDYMRDIRIMAAGLAAALMLESLIVIAEYLGYIGEEKTFLGIAAGGFEEVFAGGGSANRVGGTYRHPNYLAAALVLLLPGMLALYLSGKGKAKYLFAFALAGSIGMMFLSLSRGGWAGAALAALICGFGYLFNKKGFAILKKKTMPIIGLSLVALFFGLLYSGPIMDKLFRSNPTNIDARGDLNEMALSLIKAHPMIGTGINNSNVATEGTAMDRIYRMAFGFPPMIHNLYLLLAAEIGIPGLICFLALVIIILKRAYTSIRLHVDSDSTVILIGLSAGIVGFLLTDLFGQGLRKLEIAYLFWWQLALILFLAGTPQSDNAQNA